MERETAQVGIDTPMRAGVDEELTEVWVSLGQAPGELRLALTESGAQRLVDALERQLDVLVPRDHGCEACLDTGDLWTPMAHGAVRLSGCHCRAARR